jgi:hypothetical protein
VEDSSLDLPSISPRSAPRDGNHLLTMCHPTFLIWQVEDSSLEFSARSAGGGAQGASVLAGVQDGGGSLEQEQAQARAKRALSAAQAAEARGAPGGKRRRTQCAAAT